jgi:hypothetical protein
MAYSNGMEFLEAPAFARYVSGYLTDDEYRELQNRLAAAPEHGDVIPGTGGFRKLRWIDPRRGKGRRGGLRVIYYYFPGEQQIWADYALRQGRSFRPYAERKASFEECQ